ncbi:TPA: fimbrial protein [Serratia fonticola]|uniref:fimbrial protein n=1 Tax=Serratia fonticola TaxID=47917 RepID=UPI002176FBF6|nr:fimbrial protein [Serratia fonticola]CAI1221900.1 putative minor fimbrial subunit StfF [Serratia fonticola]CAI2497237.1 putative minor fimbrial subunit StfF [Serratia fonticola]
MKTTYYFGGLALLMIWGNPSTAAPMAATLSGTLVVTPPECILNNNQQQMVHFGDILLTRIDGSNYKRPVPLSLTCTNLAKNGLRMTLQGEATTFSSSGALKTSNGKVGVAFYVNNVREVINQPLAMSYTSLPTLEVAPVKDAAANYRDTDGGYFSALATLKVDYQ